VLGGLSPQDRKEKFRIVSQLLKYSVRQSQRMECWQGSAAIGPFPAVGEEPRFVRTLQCASRRFISQFPSPARKAAKPMAMIKRNRMSERRR
jgi:hypothetical protein